MKAKFIFFNVTIRVKKMLYNCKYEDAFLTFLFFKLSLGFISTCTHVLEATHAHKEP